MMKAEEEKHRNIGRMNKKEKNDEKNMIKNKKNKEQGEEQYGEEEQSK